MLGFGLGCTRLVILYGDHAYKIARVRPFKVLLKLLAISISKQQCLIMMRMYHFNLFLASWRYLFAGWYANKAEWDYWKATNDDRCVPVIGSYLGGFVIVQARAEPVSVQEIRKSRLGSYLERPELTSKGQYGRFKKTIRIIDFAHWRTWSLPAEAPGD